MTEEIRKLKEIIDGSDNIVFFGGAGVSTESGIPDFRSVDGLYRQQWSDPPETILSHTYYERYPEKFFAFYRAKLLCPDAKPNAAHRKLAEWERAGKLKAVITQNIDGLHQAAGSKRVIELHGSIHRCRCARCGKPCPEEAVNTGEGVPRCSCGGGALSSGRFSVGISRFLRRSTSWHSLTRIRTSHGFSLFGSRRESALRHAFSMAQRVVPFSRQA